jgi:hypothetical protein
MPLPSPSQKPPAWYTADPLRGSGKNGTFVNEDFLSALCISKSVYQEIRNTCIRILDGQAEDSSLKIDLRSIWKRRDGAQAKEMMLREFINAHPEVFGNTCRLQHVPANWDAIKWTLAELCMISANASRTGQLQRKNAGSQVNSCSESTTSSIASISVTQELPQVPRNGPHLLLTNRIILDNVVVPVVYGDRRVDILPRHFRRSDKADVPQFFDDISLDRLVSFLGQKFQTQGGLQVWGMNSTRSFIELEDDDHLTIALISFVLFAWPGGQNPPGLEVRPLRQSTSPGSPALA